MKKHQNKNQSGFSLVEIMVAAGILSIIALALASYMGHLSKQQKLAQDKIAYMQLQTHVTAVANDPQNIVEGSEVEEK